MRGPPIEAAYLFELNYMATKMNSCMCLCETTGRLTDLDFPDMLRALLRRLPICVQNKFAQFHLTKK